MTTPAATGRDPKWWTLDGGLHGRVHAPARHHDRERRAARHPATAGRDALGPAVGHRRLRAEPGRPAAHRRVAGRPLRPPAALRDRPGGLHDRLDRLRRGPGHLLPPDLTRVPGHRRRRHVRHRAGPARRGVPRQGPRYGVRRLRCDHRRGRRDRPGARRRPHQRPVVALDLLRQRADLPGRARGLADPGRGVQGPARGAARLVRLRQLLDRAGRPGLRADRGRQGRVGSRPGSSSPSRCPRLCWWCS